jgi:hypothetical protein
VSVQALALVPIGTDGTFTFNDVIASLEDRAHQGLGTSNLDDARTVYTVFVDNVGCCYAYGGQGSLWYDDGPDPTSNWNNVVFAGGARYSMIRLGWPTVSEAGIWQHEVGHNLGAVQPSAPHTSGAGHCYEGYDVMCYNDGGSWFANGGTIVMNCPDAMPDGQEIWDCGQDDYYSSSSVPEAYLANHWNLARSGWLTKLAPPSA